MQWSQIIGPLGGAIIALIGVMVSSLLSGGREHKAREDTHFSHILDRRYTLYVEYLDALDKGMTIFSGSNFMHADPDELVNKLAALERQMRVFASGEVLAAFGAYNDCVRLLSQERLDSEERHDVVTRGQRSADVSLTMVRADLRIDHYDSRAGNSTIRKTMTRRSRMTLGKRLGN